MIRTIPQKSRILPILIAILSFMLCLCGLIFAYSLQKGFPSGLTIDGWEIGGLTIEEWEKEWDKRKQTLYYSEIHFAAQSPFQAAKGTAEQLGLDFKTTEQNIRQKVASWTEGSIWKKAKHRFLARNDNIPLDLRIDHAKLNAFIMANWQKSAIPDPVSAQRVILANDTIEYIPDQKAAIIDQTKLTQQLLQALQDTLWPQLLTDHKITMNTPILTSEADITLDDLKQEGIERKIISFQTHLIPGSAGRTHNIAATAEAIHDVILAPNEIFSFGEYIRKVEQGVGFQEAPVIVDGTLVPGIGGGICQVSTTLYNAIIRQNIDVIERRNHSLPISYAPLGQDATFASDYIDFKFKNSTGKHLLIHAELKGTTLEIKLFGTAPQNVTYEIESKIVKETKPPVQYVQNDQVAKGKMKLIHPGKPGYVVETFRTKYIDGKPSEVELISTDTYIAQATLYAKHPEEIDLPDPPLPKHEVIEDGVKSS